MIHIMYAVDPIKRIVKPMSGHAVTEQDHEASSLRFAFPDNIAGTGLDSTGTAVRVMYIRPDGGDPVAKTLTFYKHSGGYYLYDWNLQKSDLSKEGGLTFSLCVFAVADGAVSVEWHTTPCQIRVLDSIHTDDSDEGDETITPTVAQRVAVLESVIQGMAGGAPVVVGSASDMTDTAQIYVLTTDGYWYYHDGSAWTAGGEYGAVATDTTLTQSGMPADAEAVGEALDSVKSSFPGIRDSDAVDVDLDISDTQGNVIARFADGHIQTKEFDSSVVLSDVATLKTDVEDINSNVGDLSDLETSAKDSLVSAINEAAQSGGSGGGGADIIRNSDAVDVDVDIADSSGNVVMRLADGHIRTSKFSSDDGEYTKTFQYNNTATTETISEFFAKGTKVIIGLQNLGTPHTNIFLNYKVTYTYSDSSGNSHAIGSSYAYDFIEFTFPSDAVSVHVSCPSTLFGSIPTEILFFIYLVPSYGRKPTIITVASDGSGDFMSIRDAVDSIPYSNECKKYEIHVHPGTYNVLSDYTSAEILADGFEGLWINNGVALIGIGGTREEIIIHGELDESAYSNTKRNDISTLNVAGDIRIENVTIEAVNLRYAIHDDTGSPTYKVNRREYINCKMVGTNLASDGNMQRSFGSGGGNRKTIYAKDCDFSDCFAAHNARNGIFSYHVILENCSARMFYVAEYPSTIPAYFTVRNCKFAYILHQQTDSTASQAVFVDGEGTEGAVMNCPSGFLYNTGDCHVFDGVTISTGKAVAITSQREPGIEVVTSVDSVYGISLGNKDGSTYVQTSGYINSNILGLSGLSAGDYLTVDSSGNVISGGTASNAIAKVKTVSDGVAYAKIML